MVTRQYSEADVKEMTKAEEILRDAGFNLDLTSEGGKRNGDRIMAYFDANLHIAITVTSVISLVNEGQEWFWLSTAQREYNKIYAEDPARAQQLEQWFVVQTDLVRDGDEGLENRSTLLNELRGRPINHLTIYEAINRIQHSGTSRFNPRRRPLVFVASPPQRDPRSHATTDATTDYKPGRLFEKGEVNKSPQDYAAENRRAAEQADREMNPEKYAKTTPAAQPDAWQFVAKSLLDKGIYHSQREALQGYYQRAEKGELSWREAASAMQELVNSFKRLIPTAKF